MSETGNHLRASVRQFDPSSCLFEWIDCKLVRNVLCQKNYPLLSLQPIPQPKDRVCVQIEEYWLSQGDMEPTVDPTYILTPSVKLNLKDLARVVAAG